jgi:hypothetical protein
MDIEDFFLIRNFRLAGNGDSFFVAISHERNYPNSGYRSKTKGKNSRILLSPGDILEFSL